MSLDRCNALKPEHFERKLKALLVTELTGLEPVKGKQLFIYMFPTIFFYLDA